MGSVFFYFKFGFRRKFGVRIRFMQKKKHKALLHLGPKINFLRFFMMKKIFQNFSILFNACKFWWEISDDKSRFWALNNQKGLIGPNFKIENRFNKFFFF